MAPAAALVVEAEVEAPAGVLLLHHRMPILVTLRVAEAPDVELVVVVVVVVLFIELNPRPEKKEAKETAAALGVAAEGHLLLPPLNVRLLPPNAQRRSMIIRLRMILFVQ